MKSRLLVALVGIPLLLVIVLACPKVLTGVVLGILCCIAAREFTIGTGLLKNPLSALWPMAAAFLIPVWAYFGSPVLIGAIGLTLLSLAVFLDAIVRYPAVRFEGAAASLFSGALIPLSLSGIVRIQVGPLGRYAVLIPILIPFIADAGAYFAGLSLGKHKMAPVLSPKKTVEGAVGGLIAGLLSIVIYGLVMQFAFHLQVNYFLCALYGVIGSAISIVGDLAFSMIKRETGIKDYGTIFKGHGGVLDRFDSVIFVTPVIELLLLLLPMISIS